MIFKPFDVVVVPFPFTDKQSEKRRPALVLSAENFHNKEEHTLLCMITSSENEPWFLDSEISDLESAGLPHASKVRMKLFTLDNELILRKMGALSKIDRKNVEKSLHSLFPYLD